MGTPRMGSDRRSPSVVVVGRIALINPAPFREPGDYENGDLSVKCLSWSGDHERTGMGVFTLFTLFTSFFDGTERQFECKKWLVVNVRSLRSGLWLKYSTNVLFVQINRYIADGSHVNPRRISR